MCRPQQINTRPQTTLIRTRPREKNSRRLTYISRQKRQTPRITSARIHPTKQALTNNLSRHKITPQLIMDIETFMDKHIP